MDDPGLFRVPASNDDVTTQGVDEEGMDTSGSGTFPFSDGNHNDRPVSSRPPATARSISLAVR